MARNDYFVIAYKILAYLYECLKDGEAPTADYLCCSNDAFQINQKYWDYIIMHLYTDGYIEGLSLINMPGGKTGYKYQPDFNITPAGIDYLQNNSALAKAKEFLKTIKDTVPGL